MKSRWSKKVVIFSSVAVTVLVLILYANFRRPQKEMDYLIDMPEGIQSEHFRRVMGQLMGPVLAEGNKIRGLNNGNEIFPAMLGAIRSAQKTICFESYIYWSGKVGQEFADALSERAKAGVKVHLLIDWLGSQKIEDRLVSQMKAAGVELQYYRPLRWYNVSRLNNRTHRKILVVDGYIGFTGGVGIADEWTGNGKQKDKWRDTHYEAIGPVAAQMQAVFMDNWLKVQPEVHASPNYFPEIKKYGDSYAQMFKSSSQEGSASVRIMYLMAIAAAKKSILIENAYFVPDAAMIKEIVKARSRGVQIEIITPRLLDNDIVRHASREQWGPLLAAGIKMYEYTAALFHNKVFIVDDYFVSIGSTNLDERSFRLNDEANLNVFDSKFALDQVTTFENDKALSEEVTFEMWKNRPWNEKAMEQIGILLHSQL